MNQSAFFKWLGAQLRNTRWSWGAVRSTDSAVFLRVWQDQIRIQDNSRFVQVTHHAAYRNKPGSCGHRERLDHVELVRGGARCYLVVCEVVDADVLPRKVRKFDAARVFPGGRVIELDGNSWIEVLPGVPAGDFLPIPSDRADRANGVE